MPPFFQPLTLARCDDRSSPSLERAEIAQLLAWLDAGNQAHGLHAVSFDFFIDWSNHKLQRVAWLKRATAPSLRLAQASPEVAEFQVARALEQDTAFGRLAAFCRANGLDLSAMVFDDKQAWVSDRSWLIQAWPAASTGGALAVAAAALSLPALKTEIIKLSGGPVQMGSKKLFYGTSCLECTLARSDAVWPGDVDLILADARSNVPVAVIELKKHTDRSKIAFSDQKLANYYSTKDGRKYDRLALLATQLTANPLPLVVLYYSTNPIHGDLIIELVEGRPGFLYADKRQQLLMHGRTSADLANAIVMTIADLT